MHTSWLTAEHYAGLSSELQQAFIAPLPAFDTINISGVDTIKYMQSQTTCDLQVLDATNFLRGAHCDAKGKMWSQFHLCYAMEDNATEINTAPLIAIAFRDELTASTEQWKKFGVFSKVSFVSGQDQYAVFGIGGNNNTELEQLIQQLGFVLPETGKLTRHNNAILLCLATNHYLMLQPIKEAQKLMNQTLPLASPNVWLAEHIRCGFSYLEQSLIGELVPQMLNLQAIDAISFTKGCYIGQETVARLKYRGGNKRAAYILQAETNELPAAGTSIELQLNENWRRTGQVINAANINNQLWLIAVLPNDITAADSLRLSSDSAPLLQIVPLPYSL